jgi:hypothetical protein
MTRVYDIRGGIGIAHRGDDLAKIIRSVEGIQPLTWKVNGGTIGSCRELSGQRIVTHTPQVHQRIEAEVMDYLPRVGEQSPREASHEALGINLGRQE